MSLFISVALLALAGFFFVSSSSVFAADKQQTLIVQGGTESVQLLNPDCYATVTTCNNIVYGKFTGQPGEGSFVGQYALDYAHPQLQTGGGNCYDYTGQVIATFKKTSLGYIVVDIKGKACEILNPGFQTTYSIGGTTNVVYSNKSLSKFKAGLLIVSDSPTTGILSFNIS